MKRTGWFARLGRARSGAWPARGALLLVLGIPLSACGSNAESPPTHRDNDAGDGGDGAGGTAGDGPSDAGASSGDAGAGAGGDASGGAAGSRGGSTSNGGSSGGAGEGADGGSGAEAGDGATGGRGGASAGSAGGGAAGTAGPGLGGGAPKAGAGGMAGGGSGSAGDSGNGGASGSAGVGGSAGSDAGPACAERCLEELGANPCGAWTCTAAGECTLAACEDGDEDGYGVGSGCACPLDCDDHDATTTVAKTAPCCRTGTGERTCTNGVWSTCSAGTPATAEACDGEDDDCDGVPDNDLGTFTCGTGACAVTVPACVDGAVSACIPGTPTSSVDSCNLIDDDCDGAVDEDCSDCIQVAPDGDDAAGAASGGMRPFRNVQSAIDYAATERKGAARVCVAMGATCGVTATYPGPSGADLRMRNGIDVLGGYESRTFTRCSTGTTRLAPATGKGVLFADDVVDPTVLDGFAIDRFASAVTAGVTVSGALNVMLSNLEIVDGPLVVSSYGVNVTNGGEATIFRSDIDAGRGTTETIGIRAFESLVLVEDNCPTPPDPATGICNAVVPTNDVDPCARASIRGPSGPSEGRPYRAAVSFERSPGSRVERSAICTLGYYHDSRSDGLRIQGNAQRVQIRASSVTSVTTREGSSAIWTSDCAGAAPWIVGNGSLRFERGPDYDGVAVIQASGDCHPVIQTNSEIFAAVNRNGVWATAISCGESSRCVIVNNPNIGTSFDDVISAYVATISMSGRGVWCEACPKISRNNITGVTRSNVGATGCNINCPIYGQGMSIGGSGLVERNRISAGCTTGFATGVSTTGNVTLRNNVIQGFAGSCSGLSPARYRAYGLVVNGGTVDVHSNSIDGGTGRPESQDCDSAGVLFQAAAGSIFRNNRLWGGPCSGNQFGGGFVERGANSDPLVFENNSFEILGYVDEGMTRLSAIQVNALSDMTVSGNIGRCQLSLTPTSSPSCVNAGTPTGAPRVDIDGQPRDTLPDIGPDEL